MYLAVLPEYRNACISILRGLVGPLSLSVSEAHLDPTVRTGIDPAYYKSVRMVRLLGGKAFAQIGGVRDAISLSSLVVDLNPRSLTAWFLLIVRAILRRRTLVWGHLNPQAGADSRTAHLRRAMRRLASGTIAYTYEDARSARLALPESAVWVAPNALYSQADLASLTAAPAYGAGDEIDRRDSVLYVGRLESPKKVALLVDGFALLKTRVPQARLVLVGAGSEEATLRRICVDRGISASVHFAGWVSSSTSLAAYYERAFASASPGFAGLSLTQSAGFGVPMAVAREEPHSPEIELANHGAVEWFDSNSPEALCSTLYQLWLRRQDLPRRDLEQWVREHYSADAMAAGLASALLNRTVE